jgi:hypothetical protein
VRKIVRQVGWCLKVQGGGAMHVVEFGPKAMRGAMQGRQGYATQPTFCVNLLGSMVLSVVLS